MEYSRRRFLNLTTSGLFRNFLAQGSQQMKRPNVVLILADDLGFGDLGCYGGSMPTPNIDRLAQRGLRFTNFHSGGPVCSVSRATLLTGRYAQRLGVPELNGVVFPPTENGLLGGITMADILRYNGYLTGCVGKWHLGHFRPEFLPVSHGFDLFRGIPYGNDMSPLPYYRDMEIVGRVDDARETLTERFAADAIDLIAQARTRENTPFFLYLAFTAPHIPLQPSAPFLGRSGAGLYRDVLLELDWYVGQVVKDLGENTLVMFTSDNGADIDPERPPSERGSNGIYSDGKFSVKEGGIRVPFIACMPGYIPENGVCNELTSSMDILPTLGILSGFDPNDPHLNRPDGIDIRSLLTGETTRVDRKKPLIHFWFEEPKCASGRYCDPAVGKEHNVKLWFKRNGPHLDLLQLQDMDEDPAETGNIAPEHPGIVAQMLRDIEEELSTFNWNTPA